MKIIDADNCVVGRLASIVAKDLIDGETVYIINAEKAVITGDPTYTINFYKQRLQRGDPYHGPFFPKHPDRILKRTVRGMINYKKPRGSKAFKRLRVFNSLPEELKDKEIQKMDKIQNKNQQYITLEKLSHRLGGA